MSIGKIGARMGGEVFVFWGEGEKKQKQEKKHGILKLDDCKRRCFLFKPIIFNGPALSFFFGGGGGFYFGAGLLEILQAVAISR